MHVTASSRYRAIGVLIATLAATAPVRGDLYVSGGQYVYEIDAQSGTVVNSVNLGTSTSGVAVGADGYLYVGLSTTNGQIDRLNLDLTGVAVYTPDSSALPFAPNQLTFGKDGNLYVGTGSSDTILQVQGPDQSSPGAAAVFATTSSTAQGLAAAPDGTMYASTSGGTISWYNTSGTSTQVVSGLSSITGLAIDSAGTDLFAREGSTILKYTINADHSLVLAKTFDESSLINGNQGLGIGPDGFLYATTKTDLGNGTYAWVVKIDPNTGSGTDFVIATVTDFHGAGGAAFIAFHVSATPEPSSVAMSGLVVLGALGLWQRGRRRAAGGASS